MKQLPSSMDITDTARVELPCLAEEDSRLRQTLGEIQNHGISAADPSEMTPQAHLQPLAPSSVSRLRNLRLSVTADRNAVQLSTDGRVQHAQSKDVKAQHNGVSVHLQP